MTSTVDPRLAASVLDATDGYHVSTRTDGTRVHYISPADTARLIRSALKLAFPGVPFGVRTRTYSGGSSINVRWTDGPAKARVDDALSGFVGRDFDGMIDMAFSSDCYMTRAGTIGFARTSGTVGSRGVIPAASSPVPYGAALVIFGSYIFTDRALTGTLPDFGDYWAWKAVHDTDRAPAPVRK